MVNYSLGKIYKIVCNTTGKVYIGSSCCPRLCRRLTKHREDYNRFLNIKENIVKTKKKMQTETYSFSNKSNNRFYNNTHIIIKSISLR
jgi:hypothetical protein